MSGVNDIALHKPATQSSVSEWSHFSSVEADAQGANMGVTPSDYGFHTAWESNPWWQVDLQEDFIIERVILINRLSASERLRNFSLLKSSDGNNWELIFQKSDGAVVGGPGNLPLVLDFPGNEHSARFIRLRLDGQNFLHFRTLQVFGRKPAPAEPLAETQLNTRPPEAPAEAAAPEPSDQTPSAEQGAEPEGHEQAAPPPAPSATESASSAKGGSWLSFLGW